MPDLVDELASTVALRLRKLGFAEPRRSVVASLLRMAYLASFKTEEGRFVRGSLTYANPRNPDENPPLMKRADYPDFTRFVEPEILTVDTLVKLARAIDRWSGSLAIHARRDEVVAWGVVDQLVGESVRVHRESERGFMNPGLLTVTMDGLGEVSAYHGDMFLGGIRAQILVTREDDAFQSKMLFDYMLEAVLPFSFAITHVLGKTHKDKDIPFYLMRRWSATVARLCIGLRRLGTGGAFLLTPKPLMRQLGVHRAFSYGRLEQAFVLSVFDKLYASEMMEQVAKFRSKRSIPFEASWEAMLAETDSDDREDEMTGAVKLVTSLAALDGLVLMTPSFAVRGFGVKIKSTREPSTVYDGADFARHNSKAKKIDPTHFGTRHGSMLRYCAEDRRALGLVVSQDGHVRFIMSSGRSLVLWDNPKLLNQGDYSAAAVRRVKSFRTRRRKARTGRPLKLGYTDTPKTLDALIKEADHLASKRPRRVPKRA
jgi:hypothetical protein